MDQQSRFLFLASTSLVLVLFYVIVLLPYQRKWEKYQRELAAYRKAQAEAALTSPTVTVEQPVVEVTGTSTTAIARPSATTTTLEVQPTEISINTRLYRIVLTSHGGRPTSWQYFDTVPQRSQSEMIEMIPQRESTPDQELPLDVEFSERPLDRAYTEFNTSIYQHEVVACDDGSTQVIFTSPLIEQLQLIRTYTFRPDTYLTHLRLVLHNLDVKANRKINNEGRGFGIAWGPGVREFPPDKPPTPRYTGYITTLYGTVKRAGYAVPPMPGSDDSSQARARREQFYRGDVQWAGVADKFFLAAIIPRSFKATQVNWVIRRRNLPADEKASSDGRFHSPPFTITLYNDPFLLEPRTQVALDYEIFVGPKRPALLREIAKETDSHLDEVLFYASWFRWMRSLKLGLMYTLNYLYEIFHNYGTAIVILTILVRIIMHPIAHKGMKMQAKTMAEMRRIKPHLDELNRKYKGDPARKNQEMMKLYKEHGISPFAPLRGCLPMLVQIPIFFALYSLLDESIDLRGASFLWMKDLSDADKLVDLTRQGLDFRIPIVMWHVDAINLLPILMGISQYLMSKLTPTTPTSDAQQQQQKQMMAIFSLMFPVMLYKFPAGLFIYWLINNVWQSAHQLIANRMIRKPTEEVAVAAKA